MVGAWGGSVSTPDSLLQLRALDWVVDGNLICLVFFVIKALFCSKKILLFQNLC